MEENTNNAAENKSANPMLIGTVLIILIVAGIGGYLWVSSDSATADPADNFVSTEAQFEQEGSPEHNEQIVSEPATTIVTMEGNNFAYTPNTISAFVGETVRVVLTSIDAPHNFVIDELNVRSSVAQPGATTTVEFTPTEPGEYEFYCSVGNHRQMGMVGTLVVE